ncbi:MAG: exodeoxyribonuclease V subunit gamma [Candidatus Symbiodolus clandestinus]
MYRSNQLELLQQLVATLMQQNLLDNPLQQEVVLIPNIGTAQWLQLQLAQTSGIAANIDCLLPATFIWRLLTQLLPQTVDTQQIFGKTAMSWKLMALLQALPPEEAYAPLKHYLQDDHLGRKRYQLAQQLADCFDRYLVYRPDWLRAWEQGALISPLSETQHWQAGLWQALLSATTSLNPALEHRATLYQRLLSELHTDNTNLPKRLFIFGISTLPPVFLALIEAISHHCTVHLMLLEPCRHHWTEPGLTLSHTPSIDHPLLVSWGQIGRELRSLLLQYDIIDIDAMVDQQPNTLLQALQYELLESPDYSVATPVIAPWQTLNPDDHSLLIHACYSPYREVELLQDILLRCLEENSELSPRDIVVMTPDLPRYLPYIQAIFGQTSPNRYLPFHLVDQPIQKNQSVIDSFLQLLMLPNSRFEAEMLLSFLEVPSVRERFAIKAEDLPVLRLWVKEVGICWGLDQQDLEKWQIKTDSRHTWKSGLQRLLSGYALSSQAGLFRDQLPYDITGNEAAELVGYLANFIEVMAEWRQCLRQPKTLTEWLPYGQQLLESFFARTSDNEETLNLILQQWQQWIQQGIDTNYSTCIDVTLLHEALTNQHQQLPSHNRFLAGAINFCTLMPMRALPHAVICLLGMNDGSFPRSHCRGQYDLLSHSPRLADGQRNQEDRYLFLEILLSARSRLHISYIGHSIQDNQPRQPAIVVNELLDHCCRYYRLASDQAAEPSMAAHNLRQQLIQQHPLMPFNKQCFLPTNPWQSYAVEWLAAAQQSSQPPKPFCPQPLPIIPTGTTPVALTSIKHFYRHPIRSFFQQRWQVAFHTPPEPLAINEPFTLDAKRRYPFNEALLVTLIQQHSPLKHYHEQVAAGKLPYGHFGQVLWQQQHQQLQSLASQLQPLLPLEQQEIELTLAGVSLQGSVFVTPERTIVRWRAVELQIPHAIELWLEHLLLCATGSAIHSDYYGLNGSYCGFAPLPSETAKTLLSEWLIGWQQGQQQPLPLLPKCGWAWLQALYQPSSQQLLSTSEALQKARQKLQQAWYGNRHFPGDCTDPYHQRLWRQLTPALITSMTDTATRFLLPLIQCRQNKSFREKADD